MDEQYIYIVEYPELDCEGKYIYGYDYLYTISESKAKDKVKQLNQNRDGWHLEASYSKQKMF